MHYLRKRSTKTKVFAERGDTIIEVMIVLAILSFAIIISYSTANRSLADARQSEENSYATELAQSQTEQIRSMTLNSNPSSTGPISNLDSHEMSGSPFCMSAGAPILTSAAALLPSNPCMQSNGGGACTTTTAVCYSLSVILTQTSQASFQSGFPDTYINTFQVHVIWPDALGEGTDTVTSTYRAYPPPAPPSS
jgi:type II secretory pathway pseudopilin PulG